jgi:[acyl-carrier-protein] S-malonyltransferase
MDSGVAVPSDSRSASAQVTRTTDQASATQPDGAPANRRIEAGAGLTAPRPGNGAAIGSVDGAADDMSVRRSMDWRVGGRAPEVVETVLVFEGQGARTIPSDPPVELAALDAVEAQTRIVRHQVERAAAWRDQGPYAVLGQSLGEISALVVAGALDLDDALTLVRLRAVLPARLLEPRAWTMASLTRVRPGDAAAAAGDLALWVIGENGPADCIVVGETEAFRQLAERIGLTPATYRELPVTYPYHTPLMRPVAEAMAAAVDELEVRAPAVPVISPIGPRPVVDAVAVRSVLVDALVSPVAWSTALTQAADRWGKARWRECGPSGSLYRFVWKNGLELDWSEA